VNQRLVVLGDSFSCGEGVGVQIAMGRTWVGILAARLELDLALHALPAMTAAEVSAHQLARALDQPAQVATVLVGLNDMIRLEFDAEAASQQVRRIVSELCAVHALVLVGRWHDPLAMFTMPKRLRTVLSTRLAAINAGIDAAIGECDRAVLLDLARIRYLRHRAAWSVDRIHPSESGHRAIAAAATKALGGHGVIASAPVADDLAVPLPAHVSRVDEIRWLIRHGGPWMVERLRKLVLPVVTATTVTRGNCSPVAIGEPALRGVETSSEQLADHG
jgi:lysophospholipase L1-like esterase